MAGILTNAGAARDFGAALFGPMGITECVVAVRELVSEVQRGDLSGIEARLTAQVAALDVMFRELARRASVNMGQYMEATEIYLRWALKAQSQSRATMETLAEIKNPRQVAFVRQTNVAMGRSR